MAGGGAHRVFFRVMLPSVIREKKLKLPVKFVRGYGDELSSTAKLSIPDGTVWNIGLEKAAGDEIWFRDGWDSFAGFHSIQSGYLMVFSYVGSSVFEVEIFDKSTCSIRYPCGDEHCVDVQRGKRQKWMKDCDCLHNKNARVDVDGGGSEEQCDLENMRSSPGRDDGGGRFATDRSPMARKNGAKRRRTRVVETAMRSPDGGGSEDQSDLEYLRSSPGKDERDGDGGQVATDRTPKARKNGARRKRAQTALSRRPDCLAASEALQIGDLEKLRSCLSARGIHTSIRLPHLSPSVYKSCKKGVQEAMNMKLKHPCFLSVVHSFTGNKLARPFTIPASFVTDHIRGECKTFRVEVFRGRGGLSKWKLGTMSREGPGLLMTTGWTDFAGDNNLGVGDVCMFQLINPEENVMRVSIFRALPEVEEEEEEEEDMIVSSEPV